MNQLQLTRHVFARLGKTLRRHSEAFLAITGPAIILIVLLSAGLAALLTRLPRHVDLKTVHYVQLAQVLLLLLDWIIGFLVFGALAAFVAGARSIGEAWRRAFDNWASILVLGLLTWVFWFGLSFTRPLLANKLSPSLNTPTAQIIWLTVSVLLIITLFTSVPARMHRKIGALDALADSMSRCGSDYLARFLISALFVAVPQAAVQAITLWITKNLQAIQQAGDMTKLQHWANWVRVYGFASYLITLLLMFVALLGFCLIYEVQKPVTQEAA